MIDVAIAAVPNQELTIQLEGIIYDIALREANGIMTASITRDGTPVARNTLAVAGTPLLPYRHQEAGNFLFTTEDEALPYYDQFGLTQFLVYVTADELAAYRAA
jgi:hypothetical protein